jgi:hypothetical protein
MIRKAFSFFLVVAFLGALWFAFAIATGIYAVYTFPPTREDPAGKTLIVSREEGEPMFNSPHYAPPVKKSTKKQSGLAFTSVQKDKQPLEDRTIVALPYISWAYKKSLEPTEQ